MRGRKTPFLRPARRILLWLGFAVSASPVPAADLDGPQVEIVRIEEEKKPTIDGRIDEEVWKTAALIPGLTQQYPHEQVAPTEKTEIRLCYDARNLYIAFRCFDSEPEKINASIMQRDQSAGPDDYVAVLLDPFATGREGFYFRLNANGAKGDGRITERLAAVQMDWDAIWEGAGARDEKGWTAEFEIPFRSVSFPKDADSWRVNFNRSISRKQERNRWSGAWLTRRYTKLEDSGVVRGFRDIDRGLGVDVKPYALGRRETGEQGDGWGGEFGGDIFWQITPSLMTTLTFNTDFAEAEVDDRVVNLTRFPLFYPEKRDFFLEGSEYFEFGPLSTSLRAFHSRTVGLSEEREKVPITAGLKVTGRQGPLGIGLLGTGLDAIEGLEKDRVYVSRLTYDLGEHSRVGQFFSCGDPQGNADNWVGGFDYSYKNSNFIGNNLFEVDVFELMSEDQGDQAHAFGVNLDYPNEPLRLYLDLKQIDEAFRPAMGFVKRPGTRRGVGIVKHKWYPESLEWLREFSLGTSYALTSTLENDVESILWKTVTFNAENPSGDEVSVAPRMGREVLFEPFDIAEGVELPVGDYRFNDVVFEVVTSKSRPVGVALETMVGEFWDGNRWGAEGEVQWRASRFFGMEAGGVFNDVDLEEGEFEVLVGFAGFRVTPNPKLSWNVLAQWDNLSDEMGLNSRVRWIVAPGRDVFFVVNKGFDVLDDRSFRSLGSETVAKVGWTFRF